VTARKELTDENHVEDVMAPRKATKKTAENARGADAVGFTDDEKAAMKERARELKAEARRKSSSAKDKSDGESDLLAKIAGMPEPDRTMATRIHALIKANAPAMTARTWYGMPAYAKDDKVVCFFQSAHKFKARYATFGFSDAALLDEGAMWPTSFALRELTPAGEAAIARLIRKAIG
jgi:hypothetical protein